MKRNTWAAIGVLAVALVLVATLSSRWTGTVPGFLALLTVVLLLWIAGPFAFGRRRFSNSVEL